MRNAVRTFSRSGWCLLAMTLVGATVAAAQDRRDSLIAGAKDEVDGAKRIQLLVAALDPTNGPPLGAWGDGVQALAQALIDDGKDSAAGVWLRWAIRLSPALEPDTVQYTPQVFAVLNAARDFVSETSTSGDTLATTTWSWPTGASDRGSAWVQVDSATAIPVQVSIDGSSPVASGGRVEVAPGSHEIRAAAAGYESVRVTREAPPGTTAVLRFALRPLLTPVTAAQTPRTPSPQMPPTVSKKRFPWALAVLGAAGAGAAVVLLKGKKSNPPTTGGITFFFPNP